MHTHTRRELVDNWRILIFKTLEPQAKRNSYKSEPYLNDAYLQITKQHMQEIHQSFVRLEDRITT